jgi:ribosomal protein S18 acetylase RimI-like enzyme
VTLPAGSSIWYALSADESSGILSAFASSDFADGSLVATEHLAGANLGQTPSLWQARYDVATGRLLQVTIAARPTRLWFVESPEPDAEPAAMNLVAFDTTHFPPGRVIDHRTFVPLPIRSDEQVAAIRWWPGTGQIHQVYVSPLHRRRGIGTAMVYAASAHLIAGGSPSRLWASGERTDLGEAFATGLPHPQRVHSRRRSLPPMTPAEDAMGVPERNLYPGS